MLLITINAALAIDINKFCSGWENLTVSECNELYEKFNTNLDYNFSNNIYSENIVINSPVTEIQEDKLNLLIDDRLNFLELQYMTKFDEYTQANDDIFVKFLENELQYYKSTKNISFELNMKNFDLNEYAKKEDLTILKSEMLNSVNADINEPTKKLDNSTLLIIFVVIGGGGFFYYKSLEDKNKKELGSQLDKAQTHKDSPDDRGYEYKELS